MIRERVVQTAAVLVLAPTFEADPQAEQYAYREGRRAQDAVRQVRRARRWSWGTKASTASRACRWALLALNPDCATVAEAPGL